MKQRFQFRHVNEIAGTFVILVVLVLIAALVWAAYSQRWFRGTVTLRIVLPEAGAAGIRSDFFGFVREDSSARGCQARWRPRVRTSGVRSCRFWRNSASEWTRGPRSARN